MAENFDTGKEVNLVRQEPVFDLSEDQKDTDVHSGEQFSKLVGDSGNGVSISKGIEFAQKVVKSMDESCNHAGSTVFYSKNAKLDADDNISELQKSVNALKKLRDLDFKYPSYMAAQKESFDRNWLSIKKDISETIIPTGEIVIELLSRFNHTRLKEQTGKQILAQLDSLAPLFEPVSERLDNLDKSDDQRPESLLKRLDKLNDQYIAIDGDRLKQEVPADRLSDTVPAWSQTLDKISWNADGAGRECTQLKSTCVRLFPDNYLPEILASKQLLEKRLQWLKTSVHDLESCPEISLKQRLELRQQLNDNVMPALSDLLTQVQIYQNNPLDEKGKAALRQMHGMAHLAACAFNDLGRASGAFKREAILGHDDVFIELQFNYGHLSGEVEYFKTGMSKLSENLDSLEKYLTYLRSLATKDSKDAWTEKDAERFSLLRDLVLDKGRDIRKAGIHPYSVEIEGEPVFANWMSGRRMMKDQLLPALASVYELVNKQNAQAPDEQLHKQIVKAANALSEKVLVFKTTCLPVFAKAQQMDAYPLAGQKSAPNETPWIDSNINADVTDILPPVNLD
jgi:hypothetical protein